ncbi:MAG: PAS domain S-box protein [Bacteroidetes bacterium]|nr:PAS domain S-box protein [Bacteroidota bacterium]
MPLSLKGNPEIEKNIELPLMIDINALTILDNIPALVFVKNERFEYVYIRDGIGANRALKSTDYLGHTDFDIFPEEMAKQHNELDKRVLETNQLVEQPMFEYRNDAGEKFYFKTVKKPIQLENGKGILGLVFDVKNEWEITQQKLEAEKFEVIISRITSKLVGLESEDSLYSVFMANAFDELNLEDCVLYKADIEKEELYQVAAYGSGKSDGKRIIAPKRYSFSKGVVGRAARTGLPQLVYNTSHDDEYVVDDHSRLSELAVPIFINGQLMGILDSEHSQVGFYTPFHQLVFETCGNILFTKLNQIQAFKKVKTTEHYLNEILESPKDLVVFSLDTQYQYKAFNQNHKNIMAAIWNKQIEIGQNMLAYITNEKDREKAKENFDRALAGEEFTLVEEYGDKKLQRNFYKDFYSPQRNEDGEVIGLTVFVRDVSVEMLYKEKLEENRQFLASLTENVKGGICRKDIQKGFVFVNSGMSQMLGYSKEEFKKLPIPNIFKSQDLANEIISILLKTKRIQDLEVELLRKDRTTFWALINCSVIKQNGSTIIDSSITDITAQKQTQQNLEKNIAELEKLNEELDHLVYRSSHDLRSPIASIKGLLGLIQIEARDKPKENDERLVYIERLLNRLDDIIHEIIDYRKMSKVDLNISSCHLHRLIEESVNSLVYMDDNERMEVSVKNLNGDYLDDLIQTDSHKLEMILGNAISNSFKYADITKSHSYINISYKIEPNYYKIIVEDNGIGIPADQQPHVFKMFHRSSNQSFGTGLGLYILQGAIQKLKGQVVLES